MIKSALKTLQMFSAYCVQFLQKYIKLSIIEANNTCKANLMGLGTVK